MPDPVSTTRTFPSPTVTYVGPPIIDPKPSCRVLLDRIHLMTMRDAEPGAVLDEIRLLIEAWRTPPPPGSNVR